MKTSKRPTVIAITALVIAVFGATPLGHAAGRMILPKGSVGTAQIRASAVTGLKVKDGSLGAADFAAGQLPAGATGPKGDKGDPGPSGMSGYELVQGNVATLNPGDEKLSIATCPTGKKPVGGGFSGNTRVAVIFSMPYGNEWRVFARNVGAIPGTLGADAVCVNAG